MNQDMSNQNQNNGLNNSNNMQGGSIPDNNKKRNTGLTILAAVIVVVIILVIALTGDEEKREMRQAEREARKEQKAEQNVNEKDLLEGEGISTQPMQPIEEGEFTYQFEGVNWIIEPSDEQGVGVPLTAVNMMFENFSRRNNGVYATFGNPYKFGTYQGECAEVPAIAFDETVETGIPIGYVHCEWQDQGTDIALFQEGDNLLAKARIYTDGEALDAPFILMSTVDLTTVVQ